MHSRPLNVAIAGLGGFAAQHHEAIRLLESTGEARLVATCDPNVAAFCSRIKDLNIEDRGVLVFDDYEVMLDACSDKIDIVVIPTPIPLHSVMHASAVRREKAVYIEKPPTLSPDELEEMIALDECSEKLSCVGFNLISQPFRKELKLRILNGEFGAVREIYLIGQSARATAYYERNNWAGRIRSPDGGHLLLDSCFANAMAHYVHNALFWSGTDNVHSWASIETVQAELYRAHDIEGADTIFSKIVTSDGKLIQLALTHAGIPSDNRLNEIIKTEKADICIDPWKATCRILWHDASRGEELLDLPPFVTVPQLAETHRLYCDYLNGEVDRPDNTLADCRSFVAFNALAYISSNAIVPFPSLGREVVSVASSGECFISINGMSNVIDSFIYEGIWPGISRGWRPEPSSNVALSQISELEDRIESILKFSAG